MEIGKYTPPAPEPVTISPEMLAISGIVERLGFVPENAEILFKLGNQLQSGDRRQSVRNEFLNEMTAARRLGINPNKTYHFATGLAGVLTLRNELHGPTVFDNPPDVRVVIEKTPNPDKRDSEIQIIEEISALERLRNAERLRQRLQPESYFTEIHQTSRLRNDRTKLDPAIQMPFIPADRNVTVMAESGRLSHSQFREVMNKHAEIIDIVVGEGGWLRDKIDGIYLLPNGRYIVLDHDQTFDFDGKRVRASGFSIDEFKRDYPPSMRTAASVIEALKRFIALADIIKDQSLQEKLIVWYYYLTDIKDNDPLELSTINPEAFSKVIRNIDRISIEDLKKYTTIRIAEKISNSR